jgi:hypothetical protein
LDHFDEAAHSFNNSTVINNIVCILTDQLSIEKYGSKFALEHEKSKILSVDD